MPRYDSTHTQTHPHTHTDIFAHTHRHLRTHFRHATAKSQFGNLFTQISFVYNRQVNIFVLSASLSLPLSLSILSCKQLCGKARYSHTLCVLVVLASPSRYPREWQIVEISQKFAMTYQFRFA